jgi:hypothetical protein
MVFGKAKDSFQLSLLKDLIRQNKNEKAKEYVKKYFIKVYDPMGVLMWIASEGKISYLTYAEAKEQFFQKEIANESFILRGWFFNWDTDLYLQIVNPKKPQIYEFKKAKYINLFPGYLHKDCAETPTKNDLEKVEKVWSHIKIVWCSNNDSLFQYVKCWIAHMVSGRKMISSLYLKSEQGTGKSIITDFLKFKVLGKISSYHIRS